MDLSVIIVNYNVKYFLDQCLCSVQKAINGIDSEVFVVDNNSVDGSVATVKEKFPWVHLTANKENIGFSKANNQAVRLSKGKYILLLNPDTLVEEDTFERCIHFMDTHPECGGLGVKMIDGKGRFLPESKRGLPLLMTSFYKMTGLTRLFPKSKRFAKYYLGHLNPEETNEVEVLSGAFMFLRKSVLDEVGLLDEDFFMYAEDIDLSYRITKAGYKNYYYPETRIIHYKGESTKKSSINYVYTFYNAMAVFVKKHFAGHSAKLLSFSIKTAIWFFAFLSILKRAVQSSWLPAVDFLTLWGGMVVIKNLWAQYRWHNSDFYPFEYLYLISIYACIILLSIFLCGGYDKPFKFKNLAKGIFSGIIVLLIFYSLLGAEQRLSRMLVLIDGIWAFTLTGLIRFVLHAVGLKDFQFNKTKEKRYIIIGEYSECLRVCSLLENIGSPIGFVGFISVENTADVSVDKYTGTKDQLREIIRIYHINEAIFCGKNIQLQDIISMMSELQQTKVEYRIAPEDSFFIIGSSTINSTEDLYTIDLNTISSPANKRNKRILDVLCSMLLFLFSPFLLFAVQKKGQFLKNCLSVFAGKISWTGYAVTVSPQYKLPGIKKGVLSPLDVVSAPASTDTIEKLNLIYAKNYKPGADLNIIFRNLKKLGNTV